MRNMYFRKCAAAVVCTAVLVISMTACGANGKTNEKKDASGKEAEQLSEYVYVSEIMELDLKDGTYLGDAKIVGNNLYYDTYVYDEITGVGTSCVIRHNMDTNTAETLPVVMDAGEGYDAYLNRYTVDEEGQIYAVWNVNPIWEEGKEYNENDRKYFLVKYDTQGVQSYSQDISSAMMEDEMNTYIQYMVVGQDGKVFASSENVIRVFGKDGSYLGKVDTNGSWIMGLAVNKEGRVFMSQYSQTGNGADLIEILPDTKTLGETYSNVPEAGNVAMIPGIKEDILVCGYNDLYAYNIAEQRSEVVLSWASCNVMGSNVRSMAAMEDGTYVAICEDYSTDTTEIVRLTRKLRSEVPQKTILTLGTFSSSQDLQRAVVNFNKKNAEYSIEINNYQIDYQEGWTQEDYNNTVAQFNASLTGDNAPDIIDINYNIDVGNLISKGALEDLMPYFESSENISTDDFVEGIIKAHTVEGKLISVPKAVTLETLMARTELVGAEPGWTLQDVMALADANPDAELMMYANKDQILNIILQYSFDAFVNINEGSCKFDSEEFMDVLKFADRFPAEYDYSQERPSLPSSIQAGSVLLSEASIHNTQAYQMYQLMFEAPVTNIGFPTFDGSQGTFLYGSEIYAIFANSENKEGAWQFIESVLQYEKPVEWGVHGFPTRKDELEEVFASDMTPDYQLDEKGEKVLDENGQPVQNAKTHWGYDDWDVAIYAATQEDVDAIVEMMNGAKSGLLLDDTLFEMIVEEAQSYFAGQKNVEEVAKIIQSRASVYVSENY